jgi:hypothetical protein
MTFVVQPSRNKMLDAAWKGYRKDQRSEKKLPKEEATKPEPDGKKTNAKLPRAKGRKQEK